ncbi:MAG: type 1 glutamine amidotransferase [Caulobacteraceae bacterium]|nr:type 1 glutamine amidotransferase [Caulobacteraceae bacterium]
MSKLAGKRVAILAADGYERAELTDPLEALRGAGAEVQIVSLKPGEIRAFEHHEPADAIAVDRTAEDASAGDYDALVIPGGVFNPDALRVDEAALTFVRGFFDAGKPVGAICHGPWVLINAGVAEGRTLTSVANIRRDLENAGARVVDREVVVEDGLVTSRTPKDLPAFCAKLIEEIAEGRHHAPQLNLGRPGVDPRSFA